MSDSQVKSGSERRVFPRAQSSTPAWYVVEEKYHRCVAQDIGVGGACLLTDEEFPEEEVEVCLELDPDWSVRATAIRLWQKPQPDGKFLVGVSYRPLRSADRHLIGPWVHKTRREAAARGD